PRQDTSAAGWAAVCCKSIRPGGVSMPATAAPSQSSTHQAAAARTGGGTSSGRVPATNAASCSVRLGPSAPRASTRGASIWTVMVGLPAGDEEWVSAQASARQLVALLDRFCHVLAVHLHRLHGHAIGEGVGELVRLEP